MTCVVCGASLAGKRPQAKYCSTNCKYKANRNLESIGNYTTSVKGRAKIMLGNARARNECSITSEWLEQKLENGVCEVTGLPFVFNHMQGKVPFSPSLDRISSNLPYTPENTRVVVWIYNSAKNVFTDEDVLTMAKALLEREK